MRLLVLLTAVLMLASPALAAPDPLAEARRLYNLGQYDAAERLARQAAAAPATANRARVVLGRIQLERYRRSTDTVHLAEARDMLRAVDPLSLDTRERVEFAIGLAETLYLEDRFGPAAELFEASLDSSPVLGLAAHERVLDWWATALDRLAQTRPAQERGPIYQRIVSRMTTEISRDPGSTPAGYWLAAAARGSGDLERAAHAATAAWVRGPFARDRGAALRRDLDRLMTQAIIPDRAARLPTREQKPALATMLAEWEAFKKSWTK
jgi:tetratricopeptide (TPR) repeat protein